MNTVILEKEYSIEKKADGDFRLVWESSTQVKKANPRTGNISGKPVTWTKYYGALWQSLIGFVKSYSEDYPMGSSLQDIENRVDYARNIVSGIMDKLSESDKVIMEEWKIVKISNN